VSVRSEGEGRKRAPFPAFGARYRRRTAATTSERLAGDVPESCHTASTPTPLLDRALGEDATLD
jgi:hypothetical protein